MFFFAPSVYGNWKKTCWKKPRHWLNSLPNPILKNKQAYVIHKKYDNIIWLQVNNMLVACNVGHFKLLVLIKEKIQEWSCVCQCCSYVLYFCLIFSIKMFIGMSLLALFFLFCTPYLSPQIPKSCTPSPHLPPIHKIYGHWNGMCTCSASQHSPPHAWQHKEKEKKKWMTLLIFKPSHSDSKKGYTLRLACQNEV